MAAQPLALVVVVVLRARAARATPRRAPKPGRRPSCGYGRPRRPARRREGLRGLQSLLRSTAQPPKAVAVLAEAHAVEHVAETVAALDGVGLSRGPAFRGGWRGERSMSSRANMRFRGGSIRSARHIQSGLGMSSSHWTIAGMLEPTREVAREQAVDVLGPLVQVQWAARRGEQPRAVLADPPDGRDLLLRHVRRVPRPLEEERGVGHPDPGEHLRELGEEVELLFPERATRTPNSRRTTRAPNTRWRTFDSPPWKRPYG